MDLTDRVALVTGGSRGIGAGICLRLAESGGRVVIGYRTSEDAAREVAERIAAEGWPEADVCRIDVDDYDDCGRAMRYVANTHGGLDVLVNNAGIGDATSIMPINPVDEWTGPVVTNLFGPMHCIKAASLYMLVAQRGSIINVTSAAALIGVAGLSSYCASKAGLVGLTKAVSREFAPHGVRVNAVAPGFTVDTGMVDRIDGERMTMFLQRVAMQRLGETREIANAVCFLASEEASYITGHTLVVDGGFTV